jgi:plasmid maintenance system antidote protein VapI
MTLYDFMAKMKLSYRKAGKFFDVDHVLIYKYVQGQRTPSLTTAVRISKKSQGMIKPEELLRGNNRKRNGDNNG